STTSAPDINGMGGLFLVDSDLRLPAAVRGQIDVSGNGGQHGGSGRGNSRLEYDGPVRLGRLRNSGRNHRSTRIAGTGGVAAHGLDRERTPDAFIVSSNHPARSVGDHGRGRTERDQLRRAL